MFKPISLNNEVSRTTSELDPDDVSRVKTCMSQFGCYRIPQWGITPISDNQMFKAITSYQRKSNLKEDGVMKPQGETETAINNELKKHKPAYAVFNGREYSVIEDGKTVLSVPAMSGLPNSQNRRSQEQYKTGPIPEGQWIMRRGKLQSRTPEDDEIFQSFSNRFDPDNSWKNKPDSWGNHRIILEPAEDTNTYGRDKMYVHGGKVPGSAGCVDLTDGMDQFADYFKNYDDDMILNVKYDQEEW